VVQYGGDTTSERRKTVEDRVAGLALVDCFDDDGDGELAGTDLDKLEQTLADADDVVTGILVSKGYTTAQLELIRTDRQIVRCWAGIVAQFAGERRHVWTDDEGGGPFEGLGQRSRIELTKLARGEIRSVEEPTAGPNLAVGGEVEHRAFFFAPDPNDPNDRGPGGF